MCHEVLFSATIITGTHKCETVCASCDVTIAYIATPSNPWQPYGICNGSDFGERRGEFSALSWSILCKWTVSGQLYCFNVTTAAIFVRWIYSIHCISFASKTSKISSSRRWPWGASCTKSCPTLSSDGTNKVVISWATQRCTTWSNDSVHFPTLRNVVQMWPSRCPKFFNDIGKSSSDVRLDRKLIRFEYILVAFLEGYNIHCIHISKH